MPKNITDQDVFTATVQGIQDGDSLNSANLADIGVQHAANRTKYLYNRSVQAKGGWLYLDAPDDRDPANWSVGSLGYTSLLVDVPISWFIPHQVGAKIAAIKARVRAAAAHGALPANKAILSLNSIEYSTGTTVPVSTLVTSVTDPSGTVSAYELPHDIDITGLDLSFTDTLSYKVTLRAEEGANSLAGMILYRIRVQLAPA